MWPSAQIAVVFSAPKSDGIPTAKHAMSTTPGHLRILDLRFAIVGCNFPLQIVNRQSKIEKFFGVLAQLVERLNGIAEVRGSNPLGSRPSVRSAPASEGL